MIPVVENCLENNQLLSFTICSLYIRKRELSEQEHVGKRFNLSPEGRGQVWHGRGGNNTGQGTSSTDVVDAGNGEESSLPRAKACHQEQRKAAVKGEGGERGGLVDFAHLSKPWRGV